MPGVDALEPGERAELHDHAHRVVEQVVAHVDAPQPSTRLDAWREHADEVAGKQATDWPSPLTGAWGGPEHPLALGGSLPGAVLAEHRVGLAFNMRQSRRGSTAGCV